MVKISVLNDNRCNNNDFLCEHGLSLFIEVDNKRILFDTGQTDIFIKNASKMNIDLDNINYIVLSHGDYDHGNGLKYLDIKVPLICHPDIKLTRISKRTGNNNGLNQTEKELKERYELIESKDPFHITPNIIFLGEIERLNDFEKEKNLPATDTYGNTYTFPDDSGLCINTNNGLIVFKLKRRVT